jgi:hypothetical protein
MILSFLQEKMVFYCYFEKSFAIDSTSSLSSAVIMEATTTLQQYFSIFLSICYIDYSLSFQFLWLLLQPAPFCYSPILTSQFGIICLEGRSQGYCKFDWNAREGRLDFVILMLRIYIVKDRYFYTFFIYIILKYWFLIAISINSLFLPIIDPR